MQGGLSFYGMAFAETGSPPMPARRTSPSDGSLWRVELWAGGLPSDRLL